jgi:hypothetical protein
MNKFNSQEDIERIVEHELSGSKCNVGYRKMMKHVMAKYGIAVQTEVIQKCLVNLDPRGVESRSKRGLRRRAYSSRGPNHILHVDGHENGN